MKPDHIQQQLTEQHRRVEELRVAIINLIAQNDEVKAIINEALRVSTKLTDNHH
jgi:hypothetical protein